MREAVKSMEPWELMSFEIVTIIDEMLRGGNAVNRVAADLAWVGFRLVLVPVLLMPGFCLRMIVVGAGLGPFDGSVIAWDL